MTAIGVRYQCCYKLTKIRQILIIKTEVACGKAKADIHKYFRTKIILTALYNGKFER